MRASLELRAGGLLVLGWALAAGPTLPAVTITEIHYDPPGQASGLEFIEILNDDPTVVDVSGWSFTDGIDFTFPRGALIPGKGYAVICADEAAFRAANGNVAVLGVFTGRLESLGETLVLTNNGGAEILRIKYSYRGNWPTEAAGTGHTLSLRRPHLPPSEPESWAPSSQLGGTPGRPNFPPAGNDDSEIIGRGATWAYKKGTEEFSSPAQAWRNVGFPTIGWLQGPAGIGYGDGDDATPIPEMMNGYWSVAARKTFSMTPQAIEAMDKLILGVTYDDGFVAYLNGAEVARMFLPGTPGDPVPFDTPAGSHEIAGEEEFEIPKSLLTPGENVLAIQGHNTTLGSSDFSLNPRLLARRILSAGPETSITFNEFFGRTSGPRWIEICNGGPSDVDLTGYLLSDSADDPVPHVLPAGSTIPAGGFLVVNESDGGLDFTAPETRLFLTSPDGLAVVTAEAFENIPQDGLPASRQGFSDARLPDGFGDFGFAIEPTPGAPNVLPVESSIVINEIFYNPPVGSPTGEFIEIHNIGETPVDVGGWAFTKGISLVLPEGWTIPPGGYGVIAADPAGLEEVHGITGVVGPWTGALSNSGEAIRLVDANGNTADEVRFHDGGRWSPWADGGGSSLELVDPRQDNSFATAWEGSDESAGAAWTLVTYTGSYNPEALSEIHFLLLAAGVVRIDDVSLKRAGSIDEHIQNGGFETDTAPWLIQGNHVASRRTTADAHSGSACLELIATGGGDNGVNKIETDTFPAMAAGSYTLSFWARWMRGADKLLTRADSRTGSSLSRVHQLGLPRALGTPGRENSVRAALRADSPDANLGPVIGDVTQAPVVPGPASAVTVRARAMDADGIAALEARYRTGGLGDGTFASAPLRDDGLSSDGKAADGLFGGVLPAQPLGTKVLFYIEGSDGLGAVRCYPVEAPASTLLYAVGLRDPTPLHLVRLTVDDDNESTLVNRYLHSDDLVDGSFVFNDEEIYYNVGVRYRGSPWNRPPDPKMYRVRFPGDHSFIRGMKSINLSRYGWEQREGAAYFCVQSASLPHSPAPVGDYLYARIYKNGGLLSGSPMAIVEPVNSTYTEKWFPGDGDGYLFKIPARRYLNDAGAMEGADFTTFAYRAIGTNYEPYRWYFIPDSNVLENRWSDLSALCGKMDVLRTLPNVFDAEIEDILDVEQFLRVEAARTIQDDWDTIGIGNGQNAYVYYPPLEGRWKLIAWDMDHTFGNTAAKLFPEGSEAQITRLVQRPAFRRMYLRILEELLATCWNPAYIGSYLTQTQAVTGLDPGPILSFINARRPSVAAQVPSTVAFRPTLIGSTAILPGWNGEHVTNRTTERFRGIAPMKIATLVVIRNREQLDLRHSWVNVTTWNVDLPLLSGENDFEVLGMSDTGGIEGTFRFRVTSTAGWAAPSVASVDPIYGPAAGGTRVRIRGSGFRNGAAVYFGAEPSPTVTVLSPTEIEADSPPGQGTVPLVVENIDQQSGFVDAAFEYVSGITFLRGDATRNGVLDITDALTILGLLFLGEEEVACLDACDVDDGGTLDLSDPVGLLNFLFAGGRAPAPPHPDPGTDLTADDPLDCAR